MSRPNRNVELDESFDERALQILIVDDERDILSTLRGVFEAYLHNIGVHTAPSGPEGLEILSRRDVDLIITDFKMPEMDGLEFLAAAGDVRPGVPRILITAFPDVDLAVRAINEGHIEHFLRKPLKREEVLEVVSRVLIRWRAKQLREHALDRSISLIERDLQRIRQDMGKA